MEYRFLIAIPILLLASAYSAPNNLVPMIWDTEFEPAVALEPISTTGCGSTKGCFLVPAGCDPKTTCNFTLTYAKQGSDRVRFEISVLRPEGAEDFYAAVGFNLETAMANASVIACTYTASSSSATVSLFQNPPKDGNNTHVPARRVPFGPADPALVRLEEAGVLNDHLICRYTRNIAVPVAKQNSVWPLNVPYHLLLARGYYNAKEKQLTHHFERTLNPALIDVTQPPKSN